MYKLDDLFKDSIHKGTLFSDEAISAIEAMIFMKKVKGNDSPYIKCQVRNKDIKLTMPRAIM